MPELPPFGRFFLPGPTEVRPEILQAQVGPMMGHRTPQTEALVGRIQEGLKDLFRTERPVYISSSSATGLMEAAIRNGVRERVLCLVNGAFSERFAKIAQGCGKEVDILEVEWGDAHRPEQVREALSSDRHDAVTVVHCETSTGVLNPVEELARVVHEAGDLALLVDGVTSVGGVPVLTDDWQLDFVLTGSQKALALPPGLALGVAQAHMLDRARQIPARGIYFDFLEFERNLEKNQTPNTPATSLLYALDAQLAAIAEETLEARWERHAAMARRTRAWVDEMGEKGLALSIVAPEGYRSDTVTCLRLPEGWTGPRLCAALSERGCTVAPGYGKLKDDMIRIGHMGDHTLDELETLLGAAEEALSS
ncbi:MAG TPA: alanine--glyoxylate aminotransferase family protein [Longimicrobiales bacterium]|nr:alanine--glyoxylate aminotransferase family protein [Longimicrobiales bacterium]